MLVTIRADASTEIGSGHIMRCLTLAEALRARGATVSFVCRGGPGNLVARITARGFPVDILRDRSPLPAETADKHGSWLGASWQDDASETISAIAARHRQVNWIIVDHYAIDTRWERQVRSVARRVLVIDDLADRPHDCDILMDQNVHTPLQDRYDALVGPATRRLLGLKYLLLRNEFASRIGLEPRRSGKVLVFFGATDPNRLTLRVLETLAIVGSALPLCVLAGSSNPMRDEIEAHCAALGHEFHADALNVAELIAGCYFAISASGFFAYELMSLRTPVLLTAHSEIQWIVAQALERLGVAVTMSPDDLVRAEPLKLGIARTMRLSPQAEGFGLVGGTGADDVVSGMRTLDYRE